MGFFDKVEVTNFEIASDSFSSFKVCPGVMHALSAYHAYITIPVFHALYGCDIC
jgi:hypothetical protein